METPNKKTSHLHIAMLPWFAYGHINPFIQLSNKLSSTHGIQISFFSIPGNIPRIKNTLNHTPPNQLIPLTIPPIQGLSAHFDSSSDMTPHTAKLLILALDQMQPQVTALLSQLKPHIILFDFGHYWLPPLAAELNIKAVFFSVFSAVANSYLTVPSRITDPNKFPTVEDLKTPPLGYPKTSITEVKTFQARDFMFIFTIFNDQISIFERGMQFLKSCNAIIYKTCTELEGPYINYIKTQIEKPVFLAGPAVPLPPSGKLDEKWEKWLGKFPEQSVIFCNFGSETYLNNDQIQELTFGLELTGLPFLLVLNFGINNVVDAEKKLEESLPEGFKERVKDRGVVITGWVQQQHILAHTSVGCYLNHAGFSSVIEGIVNNCQLAFVPQKGDQFLNSKLLSGDLKVGVEVNRRDEDGFFGKEDILEAIKIVMVHIDEEPGKSIRENHKKWRKFFLNQEIEDRYLANLVKELMGLAHKP